MEKLIRDYIYPTAPSTWRYARPDEIPNLFRDKFLEEYGEFLGAKDDQQRKEELGDLLEIVFSLIRREAFRAEDVMEIAHDKYRERGGFDHCVVLETP